MSAAKSLERPIPGDHGNSARNRVGHEPAFARVAASTFGWPSAGPLQMTVTLVNLSSGTRRLL